MKAQTEENIFHFLSFFIYFLTASRFAVYDKRCYGNHKIGKLGLNGIILQTPKAENRPQAESTYTRIPICWPKNVNLMNWPQRECTNSQKAGKPA